MARELTLLATALTLLGALEWPYGWNLLMADDQL